MYSLLRSSKVNFSLNSLANLLAVLKKFQDRPSDQISCCSGDDSSLSMSEEEEHPYPGPAASAPTDWDNPLPQDIIMLSQGRQDLKFITDHDSELSETELFDHELELDG